MTRLPAWPLRALAEVGHAPGAQRRAWDNGLAREIPGTTRGGEGKLQPPSRSTAPGQAGPPALQVRCCFKIKDHKDFLEGKSRPTTASVEDLGRGLGGGGKEPTVAPASPCLPLSPPSLPGCSSRQITEKAAHRSLDPHEEHLLGAAATPADLIRLAQLETLRFDPEFKFGIVGRA